MLRQGAQVSTTHFKGLLPDTNMVVIITFFFFTSISSVFQRGGFQFSFKDEIEVPMGETARLDVQLGKITWSQILNNSLRVQFQEGY